MIEYRIGDATRPGQDGVAFIAHICNDQGGWGAGFVLALSRRWLQPETEYRLLADEQRILGHTQVVSVEPNIYVANMIAQHGYGGGNNPPIRYGALEECLDGLAFYASAMDASVHMPRIGCGLAGGKWEKVEPIIERTLGKADVPTYVYDLPGTVGGIR